MAETADTPVLDLLASMTAESVVVSSLDPQSLMVARIAALVATDAPGVARSWVYEAAKAGRIPCVRLGGPDGPLRFLRADVERSLENARRDWLPGESAARAATRASGPLRSAGPQLRLDGLAEEATRR